MAMSHDLRPQQQLLGVNLNRDQTLKLLNDMQAAAHAMMAALMVESITWYDFGC